MGNGSADRQSLCLFLFVMRDGSAGGQGLLLITSMTWDGLADRQSLEIFASTTGDGSADWQRLWELFVYDGRRLGRLAETFGHTMTMIVRQAFLIQ
eukprot:scaffold112213_cov44-Cyclotella_meneghiniana.AAC.9